MTILSKKNRKTNENEWKFHFQTISPEHKRELDLGNSILMSELSETDDFKANYWPEVRIYEGFIAKPENLYKNSKNKAPLKGLQLDQILDSMKPPGNHIWIPRRCVI